MYFMFYIKHKYVCVTMLDSIDACFLTAVGRKRCAVFLRLMVKGENYRIGMSREKHQEEKFHLKRKENTVTVKTV